MWYGNNHMGWWGLLEAAAWLLFWGSVIWLALSFVRAPRRVDDGEDPLAIVRQRYARGEMDRATFEDVSRDLMAEHQQARGARLTAISERNN